VRADERQARLERSSGERPRSVDPGDLGTEQVFDIITAASEHERVFVSRGTRGLMPEGSRRGVTPDRSCAVSNRCLLRPDPTANVRRTPVRRLSGDLRRQALNEISETKQWARQWARQHRGTEPVGRKKGANVVEALSDKRQEILVYITECLGERGYPPSVREIGEAVGLASSSTVHAHLAVLQRGGYLRRDPTKPRAIEVRYDPASKAALPTGRVRQVPLVGDVAAGTGVLATENVTELLAVPEELTGSGPMFALRVRGDSMIDAGIFDGDLVVVREQPDAENGDLVVAGIPGDEATVKRFGRRGDSIVLEPANQDFAPMELSSAEVTVYGKVVSVMRRL